MTTKSSVKTIQVGDYLIKKTLGEGTFGKVKLGYYLVGKEKVAIKILEKSKIKEKDDLQRVTREINILQKFNHPNVILVTEIFEDIDNFYIVMEYCEGGELFNYIVKKKRLTEEVASFFFFQIINGVEYIHSKGVIHRDLKPENLLLTKDNDIKIIDFGLSNYYEGNYLSTPCGSPCYASPEMVASKKYDGFKIDIWSCGIILYAMLCGYLPFEDKSNEILYKKILHCKVDYPNHLSNKSEDLIRKILVKDPAKRIDIKGIKEHPFYLKGKEMFKQEYSYREMQKQMLLKDFHGNNMEEEELIYQPIQTEGNISTSELIDYKMTKTEGCYKDKFMTENEVHHEEKPNTSHVNDKNDKKEHLSTVPTKEVEQPKPQNKHKVKIVNTEVNLERKSRKETKHKEVKSSFIKNITSNRKCTDGFQIKSPNYHKNKSNPQPIRRQFNNKKNLYLTSTRLFSLQNKADPSKKKVPAKNQITIKNTVINVNMINPGYLISNYQVKSYLKPPTSLIKSIPLKTERKKPDLKFYDGFSGVDGSLTSYSEAIVKTQENYPVKKYSTLIPTSSNETYNNHSKVNSSKIIPKKKNCSKDKNRNININCIDNFNNCIPINNQNKKSKTLHNIKNKVKNINLQEFLAALYNKKNKNKK